MKRLLIFCFLISLCTLFLGKANAASSSLDKNLQDLIDYYRVKYKMPALALSVKLPGNNLVQDYFSGTDSLTSKTPIHEKSLFQVGGVSKSFAAAIILQLVAEEKLKLDDPLGKWLQQYPDWKEITLRQLLNETSGIFDYKTLPSLRTHSPEEEQNKLRLEELVNIAYQQKPNIIFKTGSKWEASSTNYALLGLIIQAITGHSYFDEISLRFQQPLNLSNTYYYPYPSQALDHLVHGYEPDGVTDVSYFDMSTLGPAGGVISNAHDLVLWVNDLFQGKVLQAAQLTEMTHLVSMKNGKALSNSYQQGVGLGIQAGNDGFAKKYGIIYEYKGNTLGYRAQFHYLPCFDAIVAMTISNVSLKTGEREKITEEVLKEISKSQAWQAYKKNRKLGQLPVICRKT